MNRQEQLIGDVLAFARGNRRWLFWLGLGLAAFWLLRRVKHEGGQVFWTVFGLAIAYSATGGKFLQFLPFF